jgi:hypothetical protein
LRKKQEQETGVELLVKKKVMGEPDWSFRDLTGIKPRKPEGGAAAAEYVDDDWEQTPLSFLWPLVGNTSVVCSKHSSQRGERQFDVDKELLLLRPPAKVNMCTASTTTTDHRRQTCDEDENNDDGFQEFEFSMSAAASSSTEREAPSSGMSSADELFFKGQLLPLHLPPRLRMVQRLASSSEKKPQQLESVNTSQIVPVLQAPQATRVLRPSFHPKFSKLWMQNADLLSADGTAVVTDTAGIARFRGHSWSDPPRDRDSSSSSTDSCRDSTSARDSSSSRDSSGSSQDANFSDSSGSCNKAFQMPPISSDLKGSFLHNREVFGTHVRSFEQQQQRSSSSSSSTISSWLKPPFKWKVLFGAAKKVTATTRSSPSRDLKGGQQRQHQQSLSHVSEEEEGEEEEESSCSDPIEDAKCSEETNFCQEDNSGGELSLQTGSSSYSSYMETTTSSSSSRGLVSSGDIERGDHQRGMAKAREYLHKYMKMLKPLHLKKYEQQELDDVSSCRFTGSFSLPSSSLAHETRRHSRNHIAPGNRSFSSSYSSQSSRFASVTADVVGSPRSRSAVGTPTRRGSGRPLSSGSIAELHSAIQGAIAHCKESQTTAKYESLARRSQRFGSSSSAAAAVR